MLQFFDWFVVTKSVFPLVECHNSFIANTREAVKLHNKGVKIIIGLGHSGYEKDIEIAQKVPFIDAVVGGHTHSFLYPDGQENPSNNIVEGPYPTIVTKDNGKSAAVVQAMIVYLG